MLTVYLTGEPSEAVQQVSASDEVIFLDFSSKGVGGLKLAAIRALRKIAASRDFALVIAHRAKPTYIACLATKLPVISVHHAFGDYRRAAAAGSPTRSKRLSLLAVSDAVRNDIRRCLPQWPAEKIETLHNRIDVAALQAGVAPRAAAREALGLPQDVPVIGNVGRLHPDKDQATLIQASPRHCRACRPARCWRLPAAAAGRGTEGAGRRPWHCRPRPLSRPGAGRSPIFFRLRSVRTQFRSRALRHGAAGSDGRRRAGDGHRLRRRSGSRR